MLLLYKYALILVILLNINEIRSRTLNDLQGGDLQPHNGTVTSLIGAVTEHDRVHNLREKRARDSEEEDEENDDDEDDDEAEDDDSTDEDEPSEKAAVELDENYMKNHDMVDTHMSELYNEVVGGKKKTKSSTKDGANKYEVKPEIEETDKVDYEKDKDQGEKTPSKKKKKGGKDKFMPLLIIPYAIQMVIIPFVLLKLKMIALKAMAVGKLALLILLFNYFKYQHNAKASSADEQYIHDNQLMSEHYGYSGTPEVGGWVNGRSMEEFGRRRRR